MGQKTHPTGYRLGITTNWKSHWFGRDDEDYSKNILEDLKIRKFIKDEVGRAGIKDIEIERSFNRVKILVQVARPGMMIGRGGATIEVLRSGLEKMCGVKPELSVEEVKYPARSAALVADTIARQIERRRAPQRLMVSEAEKTMQKGAHGIKIEVSGRLGGATIARQARISRGSVPLQTLRAQVDYAQDEARTKYGTLGVKVWIYLGELSE